MDSFVRSELGNGRFEFIPVIDPIHWRFEDRSMRWSSDPYRFVQWRPDGDSVRKPRHFMWVFALVPLSLFTVLSSVLYVTCIITCDRLFYFISLITCTSSWNINDCTSYLFGCFEILLSFHVGSCHCWLRPSIGYPVLWLDLICWPTSYLKIEERSYAYHLSVVVGDYFRLELLWILRKY